MIAKRTVVFEWSGHRFEFGPWWWRWWLLLTTDGRAHHTMIGEPCVLYHEPPV